MESIRSVNTRTFEVVPMDGGLAVRSAGENVAILRHESNGSYTGIAGDRQWYFDDQGDRVSLASVQGHFGEVVMAIGERNTSEIKLTDKSTYSVHPSEADPHCYILRDQAQTSLLRFDRNGPNQQRITLEDLGFVNSPVFPPLLLTGLFLMTRKGVI